MTITLNWVFCIINYNLMNVRTLLIKVMLRGLLLLLMVAHAKVALSGSHVSAPALGSLREVWHAPFCQSQLLAMTIDSLQPGYGWSPSRSPPYFFRDDPAEVHSRNFTTWPNIRNWRCLIMQVTQFILVTWKTLSLEKSCPSSSP